MKLSFFALLLCCTGPLAVFGQEYGYTHYDSKDGLAGSTVYCMAKDKEGFLWFGTEGGLSRFDGTHFKNFTKEDGLPDNEVLQLFADSRGRVWISPFNKSVCYYYKGKIYTPDNDLPLQRIHVEDHIVQFAEDKSGNIMLRDPKKLHVIDTNGRITVITKINEEPTFRISGINTNDKGEFMIIESGRIFDYRNNRFYLRKVISSHSDHFSYFAINPKLLVRWRDTEITEVLSFAHDRKFTFPFKNTHIRYSIIDDSLVGHCLKDGAVIYNINGSDSPRYFLKDLPVNGMLKDAEGSIWFSTLGHGVYKLSSPFVLNVKLRKHNMPVQVFAFTRYKQSILASTELHVMYSLNRITGRLEKENIINKNFTINPFTSLSVYNEKDIICGSDQCLYKLGPDFKMKMFVFPLVVKDIFLYNGNLFVATSENVSVIDPETFKITDTLWHERSTAVFVDNDTVYIGTVAGLHRQLPDRSMQFLGEKAPALKSRITTIQKDPTTGVLWIGTYGGGLIGYKNNRIVASLNRRNGLTSNVCRTLYLQGNYLWVGTDRGISKINITRPDYPVTKYTTSDGLASDVINAIYVDSNKVFVGTPEGYTFFDEERIINQSRCDLLFTDITMGGEHYLVDSIPAAIPHGKNNIRFDFVGISYRSGGDVRYRYRLLGLDSTWQETRETFLSYPTLPSGDYQLQVQAINKFDVTSKLITAGFTIEKLLYEKIWFRVLIGLAFLSLTGLLVWVTSRRTRKREREKTDFIKRISELEQLSRKAQMNPHFIFNSLNSIQQYVMDADVAGANKFISGFSRLIRQTLDFSSKREISLEEELGYLTNYLDLEKTRLENAFSWSVALEDGVDPAEYYIPPMILQPFVENSVRHGLRFRKDKKGVVTITVKRESDDLICIIEDNGVGRKAAMQYKSITPINYQSKGLSLTADRITMFNMEHVQKINMHINDLEDEFHNSLGTRVTISFPIF